MSVLHERYEARPEAVSRARRDVADFAQAAGACDAQVQGIRLAVSEAVTNAVLHGYRGAAGEVRVTAEVDGPQLSIAVRDDGAGLRPRATRPGLGCGLRLIGEVADEMAVGPCPQGGTELSMRFALVAQPLAAAAA